MRLYNIVLMALLAGPAMSSITGCGLVDQGVDKYNLLTDKDEACTSAWADYEAALQRRADLIPQLVAVVKGSAAHEETTLVAVTQARADATRPEIKLDPKSGDLEDPAKFAAFQQAQSTLGTQMSRLLVASENYPTLQANAQFHDLNISIEGTENRLLRAREQYNKAVLSFNTELRHVSGKILNPVTGHEFRVKPYFQADADSKVAPKIDFGTPPAASAIKPATSGN